MRKLVLGLILVSVCFSATGCGGCGGGLSEAQLRRRAIKRTPDDEPPPATTVAATEEVAAAQPRPTSTNNSEPKTISPGNVAATKPLPLPPPAPPAAPPPPPSNKTAVQGADPLNPLSPAERRQRSMANLEKIGDALMAHVGRTGALPAVIRNEDGKPLLSWRVVLLPDLGYAKLFRQFRLEEPWDSPHNRKLMEQMPPEFESPERLDLKTNYLGVAGPGQAFCGPRGLILGVIEDGPENTVLVVEVDDDRAAPWSAPTDYVPLTDAPRQGLGGLRSDGIFAVTGSGKVVRLSQELTDQQFLALLSHDGHEPIAAGELLKEATAEPVETAVATATGPAPPVSDSPPMTEPMPAAPQAVATSEAPPEPDALPGNQPPVAEPGRIAVPPDESLAEARKLLRDLYGKEYEAARSWEDKSRLSQKLLSEAAKIEKNPTHYYELLRIAREVAVSGGDVNNALQAIELLTQRFQVDGPALRLKLLEDLSKSLRKADSVAALCTEAHKLLLDAFEADQFDVALPAYDHLFEFTRLKGDRAELARLTQRKQPLEAAQQAYLSSRAAEEVLATNPNDPAASETRGKYLCFVKNRWDEGLPYLVRSADVKLRVVATIDLESRRSPQETYSLAEQYWEMASESKQPYSRGLHLRAVRHYQTAIILLSDGLEKLKSQKRIDEASDLYGKEEVQRILAPVPAQTAQTMD